MEALQAQIEPHFLFNTLASIDQLIQTDPKRASEMQQEPDPLPALGDAADARRQSAYTRSAGEPVERVPGNNGHSDGGAPATGRQRARRPEIGGVPAHDAADAGREFDQARSRAEGGRRQAGDQRGDRRWTACRARADDGKGFVPKARAASDSPTSASDCRQCTRAGPS